MKIRNKAIPAAYLLLIKEGQLMLSKRLNTGYHDDQYQVLAGHLDAGEVPTQSLIREAKEEANIDIRLEDLELVHVSYRPKHDATDNRVDFFFRCQKWSGNIKNPEPHKCSGWEWFPLDNLPSNLMHPVVEAVRAMNKKTFFEEMDLDYLRKIGEYKQ